GHVVAPHGQELLKTLARGGLVIDNQDSMILHPVRMPKTLRRNGSARRLGRHARVGPRAPRRDGVEGLSVPHRTLAHDVATMARAGHARTSRTCEFCHAGIDHSSRAWCST